MYAQVALMGSFSKTESVINATIFKTGVIVVKMRILASLTVVIRIQGTSTALSRIGVSASLKKGLFGILRS